ncbi:MAG: thioredoxin family protein [Halioglobus sp.]|nr:thioredoxin family protein [Halioglobus sp.]
MKNIEVLGSGCSKCVKTAELVQAVADDCRVSVQVTKETNPQALLTYHVMSTPAVVVDGQLMHSGSIPDKTQIEKWLQ